MTASELRRASRTLIPVAAAIAGLATGCSSGPLVSGCGDGTVDETLGEECDDGNETSGDGCSSACLAEGSLCGNSTLDEGEQCDDGNRDGGDGCSANCVVECGNGRLDANEECEPALTPSDCDFTCHWISGGDGDADADADAGSTGDASCTDGCETEGVTQCVAETRARRCLAAGGALCWEEVDCGFPCLPEPSVCYEGCEANCEPPGESCTGPSSIQRCVERAPGCYRWLRRDCPSGVVCFSSPDACWGDG